MIIWWGTYLLFASDKRTHLRECPQCGKRGRLSSFDAVKFFHLYNIPLIPLGKKHISDKCSACNAYLQVGLNDWKQAKEQAVGYIQANMQTALANPQESIEFHEMVDNYQGIQAAAELANVLEGEHPENAPLLAYLGDWYRSVNNRKRATDLFDAVLTIDPDHSEALRFRAHTFIRQERFVDAAKAFMNVLEPDWDRDIGHLNSLIGNLRKTGDLEDGYRLCEYLIDHFPKKGRKHGVVKSFVKAFEKKMNISPGILARGAQ